MIDINLLRSDPDMIQTALRRRGLPEGKAAEALEADAALREAIRQSEAIRQELNRLSESGRRPDAAVRERAQKLKEELRHWEIEERERAAKRDELLEALPNIPAANVPDGLDANDNVVVREEGEKRHFSFTPKDYLTLAEAHDLIDMKRGARVAGARFGYLKREAAVLEFALVDYTVKTLVAEGFIPVIPPVMIRPAVYRGMGRLAADQKAERYYLPADDLYLVGSAEHTLGPLHMDEVLEEASLPIRYVGFSTCFRREAGSYGKDTKGILRVHQFDKVEMFVFSKPEDSEREHERLVSWQEKIVGGLGLPYRIVEICTGDMGWTDARQFDVEVWLPGEQAWRETHSASNTTDFQARGINARFRRKGGKPEYLHLLNATALAIGRALIAIIENYQNEDGTIDVPEILRPYCGFDRIPSQARREE